MWSNLIKAALGTLSIVYSLVMVSFIGPSIGWCRKAPSHYLIQFRYRSMSEYFVTRPQWVEKGMHWWEPELVTTCCTPRWILYRSPCPWGFVCNFGIGVMFFVLVTAFLNSIGCYIFHLSKYLCDTHAHKFEVFKSWWKECWNRGSTLFTSCCLISCDIPRNVILNITD